MISKFKVIRNIQSEKINILENTWIIENAKVYKNNNYNNVEKLYLETNLILREFNHYTLNLSALSLFELYELRNNYKKLNYSIVDIDLHIIKILFIHFFIIDYTFFIIDYVNY